MSKKAVKQVLARMVSDEAFRRQVKSGIEAALRDVDLTPEERAALAKQALPPEAKALHQRKSKTAIVHWSLIAGHDIKSK